MHVELTPAVLAGLETVSADLRRRFFLVADHLTAHPGLDKPNESDAFWQTGTHFSIYRPPIVLGGLFMEDVRIIYQLSALRDETGEWQDRVQVYAFSEGPDPIAGWEFHRRR